MGDGHRKLQEALWRLAVAETLAALGFVSGRQKTAKGDHPLPKIFVGKLKLPKFLKFRKFKIHYLFLNLNICSLSVNHFSCSSCL